MRGGLVGRSGSNPGMVEAKLVDGQQLVRAGGGEGGKRRGVAAPPLAGIRRGGQRRQRGQRSRSR